MAINVLISPTMAAATSLPFSSSGKNNVGLCCNGLQTTETITLQVYDWANSSWKNAMSNGNLFQITANSNFMTISEDAQTYRVVKTATVASIGLNTISDVKFLGLS
jgi:uncharacterized protein YaiE (UPF0345 family)